MLVMSDKSSQIKKVHWTIRLLLEWQGLLHFRMGDKITKKLFEAKKRTAEKERKCLKMKDKVGDFFY